MGRTAAAAMHPGHGVGKTNKKTFSAIYMVALHSADVTPATVEAPLLITVHKEKYLLRSPVTQAQSVIYRLFISVGGIE